MAEGALALPVMLSRDVLFDISLVRARASLMAVSGCVMPLVRIVVYVCLSPPSIASFMAAPCTSLTPTISCRHFGVHRVGVWPTRRLIPVIARLGCRHHRPTAQVAGVGASPPPWRTQLAHPPPGDSRAGVCAFRSPAFARATEPSVSESGGLGPYRSEERGCGSPMRCCNGVVESVAVNRPLILARFGLAPKAPKRTVSGACAPQSDILLFLLL